MRAKWQLSSGIGPTLVLLMLMSPSSAAADPIVSIIVSFEVSGAPNDPVYGSATGSGAFSFSPSVIPEGGGELISATGLPIQWLTFDWAGHTWRAADAGVTDLRFDASGTLTSWAFGGAPFGFNGITHNIGADVAVGAAPFPASPLPCCFSYSTVNSAALGIFGGQLLSWDLTQVPADPAAVPEPASLLLVGSGVAAIVLRDRRRWRQ